MKIRIERKALLSALMNAANNVVPGKSIIPILQLIKIDVLEGEIIITSSDSEVFLVEKIAAETIKIFTKEDPGYKQGYMVAASNITNLIKKIETETITIEFFEVYASILSEMGKFKLPLVDGKDFISIKEMKKANIISIETDIMQNYINKALPFTINDEFKPIFDCIHFIIKDKKIIIESMDGVKCLKAIDSTEIEADFDVAIPKKIASIYSKIFPEKTTTIKLDSNFIEFSCDKFAISGVLLHNKFPNTEEIFGRDRPNKIDLIKDEIIASIERLTVLYQIKNKFITFRLKENELTLSMKDSDFGTEGRETFAYDYTDADLEISFSSKHLLIAIRAFRSEKLKLDLTETNGPVVFSDDVNAVKTLLAAIRP